MCIEHLWCRRRISWRKNLMTNDIHTNSSSIRAHDLEQPSRKGHWRKGIRISALCNQLELQTQAVINRLGLALIPNTEGITVYHRQLFTINFIKVLKTCKISRVFTITNIYSLNLQLKFGKYFSSFYNLFCDKVVQKEN